MSDVLNINVGDNQIQSSHFKELLGITINHSLYIHFTKGSSSIFASNPLSAKILKWSNTLKQFVGNPATNCLSVFDHFVGLALKGLILNKFKQIT